MNPNDFNNIAAGKCIKHLRGYHAFFPNPLPPKVEVDWALTNLISDADRAISELSGIGRYLQNPHILMAPYIRREAILSSKIEDTHAGIEDLFAFEVDESDERTPDVREVANYVKAMNHGLGLLKELPICSRLICELHRILLTNVRGSSIRPGEFRTTQNWIGRPGCNLNDATFVPIPPEELATGISALEQYVNSENIVEPPLIRCAYLHYQFEALHPFPDGNGRVGRLLITLFLCAQGHLSQPLLYLSEFFEQYRSDYYRHLLGVSQQGLWREWLEFFLRGVIVTAKNACNSAASLIELNRTYREKLGSRRVPEAASRLIDQIFINPLIVPVKLSKEWNMSFPTIMKGIDRLVELGILHETTGQQRNRIYKAAGVVALFGGKSL